MSNTNLPLGFYFKVSISGGSDAAFQEVSGISMKMNTEEIEEAGSNRFKYKMPTAAQYSNLVLKRGIISKDSALAQWCTATLNGDLSRPIETKFLTVALLDEKGKPLASWNFVNAWPVKWEVSDLKSMENELAIESLELAYNYFTKE